jgi:hypothetical protein
MQDLSTSTEPTLTVTIDHSGPIELELLTESLQALARQHLRFAQREGRIAGDEVARLYVREIRSGSIVVDLVALIATVAMIPEAVNTIVDFTRNIRDVVSYFRGQLESPPEGTSAADAEDIATVLKPIASDPKATVQFVARDNATVNLTLNINSLEANAIQNRARNFAAVKAEPVRGMVFGQLFYWFQARGQARAKSGDKGIIEAVSRKPVKVIFSDDGTKGQMLTEALFQKAYVVDVDVQTIGDEPRLYKIVRLVESFDRDE